MVNSLVYSIGPGILALVFAAILARFILKKDRGSEKMIEISDATHEGAMAFLFREYKVM